MYHKVRIGNFSGVEISSCVKNVLTRPLEFDAHFWFSTFPWSIQKVVTPKLKALLRDMFPHLGLFVKVRTIFFSKLTRKCPKWIANVPKFFGRLYPNVVANLKGPSSNDTVVKWRWLVSILNLDHHEWYRNRGRWQDRWFLEWISPRPTKQSFNGLFDWENVSILKWVRILWLVRWREKNQPMTQNVSTELSHDIPRRSAQELHKRHIVECDISSFCVVEHHSGESSNQTGHTGL